MGQKPGFFLNEPTLPLPEKAGFLVNNAIPCSSVETERRTTNLEVGSSNLSGGTGFYMIDITTPDTPRIMDSELLSSPNWGGCSIRLPF